MCFKPENLVGVNGRRQLRAKGPCPPEFSYMRIAYNIVDNDLQPVYMIKTKVAFLEGRL